MTVGRLSLLPFPDSVGLRPSASLSEGEHRWDTVAVTINGGYANLPCLSHLTSLLQTQSPPPPSAPSSTLRAQSACARLGRQSMYRRSGGDDTPDETVNDWRDGQHRVRRSRVHAWHGRGYAPTGRKGRRVRRTVRSEATLTADRAGKKRRPSSPNCRRTVLGNRHRRPCL